MSNYTRDCSADGTPYMDLSPAAVMDLHHEIARLNSLVEELNSELLHARLENIGKVHPCMHPCNAPMSENLASALAENDALRDTIKKLEKQLDDNAAIYDELRSRMDQSTRAILPLLSSLDLRNRKNRSDFGK